MSTSRTPPVDTPPRPVVTTEPVADATRQLGSFGPYEVAGQLGFGGMCQVFLGRDNAGREVALKVLAFPEAGGIDDRRFEREGHLLQALHHPNIVGIVGQGVDAKTGRAYLALELVPGRDLLSILSDCPEGKLSLEEACFVIEKVARALSAVHELEIVHRDIKPGNVLVTPEGQVKVTDFGIALMQGATRLTNPQEIVGTAQYMAPEAIEDGDYTPAVDIYALGSLAFRLLTGRDLFPYDSVLQVARAHVEQPAPRLEHHAPELPESICALVARMLSKDPARRPSAVQVVEALAQHSPHTTHMARFWQEAAEAERQRAISARLRMQQSLATDAQLDAYRIVREIGRGGMGAVYEAEHLGLKKRVALKVLLAGAFATDEERRRFLKEAESAASVLHPNIVPILDAGESEGTSFIAMEYVRGGSLARHLRERTFAIQPMLHQFVLICDAVHHAHEQGLVHRDLKPENVLVDEEGAPHILDFGIAKRLDHDRTQSQLTVDGSILGTIKYMPPEQAEGRIRDVDARSDVYALGTILYEILTGTTPFTGTAQEILVQIPRDEPLAPSLRRPSTPRELDAICLKALEKEKDRRYASALALKEDVERFLRGEPILARPATAAYRLRKWLTRHRRQVIASAVTASLFVALALTWGYQLVIRKRQRQAEVVETTARGWERFSERDYTMASKCFVWAVSHLEGDEQLAIPNSLRAKLPPDLPAPTPLQIDRSTLERWNQLADQRREFEVVNGLLAAARDRLAEGRAEDAIEPLLKAALASPNDPELVAIKETVVARLTERAVVLLQAGRSTASELDTRERLVQAGRNLVEQASRVDGDSHRVAATLEVLQQTEGQLELARARAKSLEEARRRSLRAEEHMRVVLSPAGGIPADGAASATIELVVHDDSGVPQLGQVVLFRASREGVTVIQPEGPTGADGRAKGVITSTVAGITTLTVVINPGTDALTLVQQPTVEFVAGPPEPGACQLAAPNEPVPADGATAAPLELRVLDAHGNAVAGQRVEVSVTGTGNALEPNGAVTDGAGIARVALRSTVAEVKTATWALGRGEERAAVPGATAVRFRPGPVSAGSTVAAAPSTRAVADGAARVELRVKVVDGHGNPISGRRVRFAVSGSGNVVTQPETPTDAVGVAVGSFTSVVAEGKSISCVVDPGPNAVALDARPVVELSAGPLHPESCRLQRAASAADVVADGASQHTVVVTLADAHGNPIAGQPVELRLAGVSASVDRPSAVSEANGTAAFRVASTVAGRATVTAAITAESRALTLPGQVELTFVPGPVATEPSSLVAAPASGVVADGRQAASVVITLVDAHGNPISGRAVGLAVSGSANTVRMLASQTDDHGRVHGTLSSTVAEAKELTCLLDPGPNQVPCGLAARVEFVAGPSPGASSVLLEGSGPIAADGETRGTVTILVRDAHGNPVAGARVGLETVEGDAALEQPATPTGPDGRVTGTVASEVAGAVQIRAVLYTGEGAQPLPKAVTVEFAAP